MTTERSEYRFSSWLYLRVLGLVYLVAFVSVWVQVEGLLGSRGIAPVAGLLEVVEMGDEGAERILAHPSLFWIESSDLALHVVCGLGALLAVATLAGLAQQTSLAALWVLYLSLAAVGQDFLAFPWDDLLLEAGLLAAFLAPFWRFQVEPKPPQPSKLALWLHWWLLFRLTFSSGVVKLAGGEESWIGLTALAHHFQTQPIPNRVAWYAHQLPDGVLAAMGVGLLAVELAVPFAVFGPARLKRIAALVLAALQVALALTGNFAFFNLLTLALCLPLLDDDWWRRRWLGDRLGIPGFFGFERRDWAAVPLAAVVLLGSAVHLAAALRLDVPWPAPVATFQRWEAPWRVVNNYGLLQATSAERPEIEVQGSLDGREWKSYRFKYKPGDPLRPPPFVAPHQPRLDGQMWLAALGEARSNTWFFYFLARLAEGSPPVLGLLAEDPFEGEPPSHLRALTYEYAFTDAEERWQSGAWWKREFRGVYLEPTPATRLVRLFPAPE